MTQDRKRNDILDISRRILDAFLKIQRPCKASEICTLVDLPHSSIYNTLKKMSTVGLLDKLDGSRYFLSAKFLVYGDLYTQHQNKLPHISDLVDALAMVTGCTSQLCTLAKYKYMVIHECVPDVDYAVRSEVMGQNIPVTWTASGRLLLSNIPLKEIRENLEEFELKGPDSRAIDFEKFRAEMDQFCDQGYFQTPSMMSSDYMCFATPIYDENFNCIYTFCVTAHNKILADPSNRVLETLQAYRAKAQDVFCPPRTF